MASYRVTEARTQLSRLIERAIAGEEVVITRRGKPVVTLAATKPPVRRGRPLTQADADWLRARRIDTGVFDDNPVSIVERMRDEDEDRFFKR